MTDPVSRAARRQNLLDRIGEHLTEWGCPPDDAEPRARALLHDVEQAGWQLPTVDAPPLAGRGSTDEGRERARRVFEQARVGCTCDRIGLLPEWHPAGCPVREAGGTATPDGTAKGPSSPQDKIDRVSRVQVPATGFRNSDGTPE